MKRRSGRRLMGAKVYQSEGFVQKFDYSTQKLEVDDKGNTVKYKVFYNLLEGPTVSGFEYKPSISINTSEFTVESKSPFVINPEDRFFLEDGSFGKVSNNRLINQKTYNRGRRKNKSNNKTYFEQIIQAG